MVKEIRLVENFLDMVKISSPSLKEREMGDYLIKVLSELGMEVYEDQAGTINNGNCGNIIGVLKAPGKKRVLLSAHMDTVLPCDKVVPVIEGRIIKSDGTTVLGGDDKGGIAAIIETLRVIKENNIDHPEIVVVFSIAEEIGLLGAKSIEIEKYNIDYGFILDSSGKPGVGIIKAPCAAKGKLIVEGKPAHAGIAPENGINALVVAAEAIGKIKLGRIDEQTTSNIGIVKGGEAVNIVMPSLEMMYEARSLNGEVLRNLLSETMSTFEEVCKAHGAQFKNTVEIGYDGFSIDENAEIVKIFERACKKSNILCQLKSSGGGSDTNIYNTKGIPCLNLAVGMTKVHTKEEFIEIDDMVNMAKLLLEIIKEK
ncbi:M20/M25/M40 family metallo-hydrolase [Cetobacterium sp. SF1]|uniref:M20/M25/M40 family metallo-hydrolase n=1 Tax=unclassified Cetobacterium TaxID=2630983 RepID=UPI003CE93928